MDDKYLSRPEVSTPIIGSVSDMNPGNKGVDFVVNNSLNFVTIILPLQQTIRIERLVKLQILRPSNINRFRLTFLDKHRRPVGQYQILSTDGKQLSIPPTIDNFPIQVNLLKKIRFLKLDSLDTNDNGPPKRVIISFQACFKKTKAPNISKPIT